MVDLLSEETSKLESESKTEGEIEANPEAKKLEESIEKVKKEKYAVVDEIKRLRSRLAYKKSEYLAITKLLEMNTDRTKNIGYLKRLKEKLEFAISTEAALTPDKEKEIIRRINSVNEELDKSLRNYRMRKKAESINSAIDELQKGIEELEKKITDYNKQLDELYYKLRETTGYGKHSQKGRREKREQKPAEISFADIAVIRGKDDGSKQGNNDIVDAAESN